jgi:hypothetical protein
MTDGMQVNGYWVFIGTAAKGDGSYYGHVQYSQGDLPVSKHITYSDTSFLTVTEAEQYALKRITQLIESGYA